MSGDFFVGCVVVLQALATLTYCYQGEWRQAGVWGGAAASNVAYLAMVRG